MKQVLLSFVLLNIVFLSGCATAQTSAKTKTDSKPEVKQQQTFEGDYQSSRGVMTPLSCYCSDGGTLTVTEDEKIKVCFDGLKEKPDDCTKISVTGQFQTVANEPEETNPCPKGTMKVFVVESFKCK
ncbi:MAG: hypothetical protein A3D31_06950 [Candidatus Fluviicola riflensis]|nr:MAG: hypothetical protein CHH17_08060 [Candidatus Fluviicola riflensis]OGS79690.1 MAG: hypothetical protein A3D31_06950 [Candidatus Fluviicola riflensis]OGS87122.1 MAG: hypothetical protein A2724_06410 [Fluviicola sp. RIFCSPHIGHO2_01_FULL_43_53]OGS89911.1 MAG: hypothetical protein A3E30_03155 [Fluviicola sp. RIFCSPHIGHO2_12_FULL_43_24]